MSTPHFYDRYHRQNNQYQGIVKPGNFTYTLTLEWLATLYTPSEWRGKTVLDVGCGVGSVSLYLADLGASVTAVDISPRAIAIAQQAALQRTDWKVKFIKSTFPSHNITKKFDVILAFEVLEHIPDEKAFIKALYKHLKPGGHVVLSTPHQQNLLTRHGFHQGFDRRVGHQRRYNVAGLLSLLRSEKFKVKKYRLNEGVLRNALFTQSSLGWMVRFVKGPLVSIFQVVDQFSGHLAGFTDIQVIAQRSKKAV